MPCERILFVHGNEPGTPLDTTQIRALRSHVRRVNLERLQQRSTQRMEIFRSLSVQDFSPNGNIRPEKRRFPVRSDPGQAFSPSPGPEGPSDTYLVHCLPFQSTQITDRADKPLAIFDGEPCLWVGADDQCSQAATGEYAAIDATEQHPYVQQISAIVQLDEVLMDRLLRSCQ